MKSTVSAPHGKPAARPGKDTRPARGPVAPARDRTSTPLPDRKQRM
ncbi:hypothetical protein [Streptomyces mexicanus]